jgi:putative endonuclease
MEHGYTVYVVRSMRNGWLYIGMTRDVSRRLREHNRGHNTSTRGKGPFQVVHQEQFASRGEARQREKKLKSGAGREWLNAALRG